MVSGWPCVCSGHADCEALDLNEQFAFYRVVCTLSDRAIGYTYDYPRAALTVDCVVFGLDDEALKLMLIQRDLPPFAGQWALPGGFVQIDESLEEAARRELDKRNFRKRVLAMGLLIELDEVQQDVAHRAARLYRFDERKYRRLVKQGFDFEL
jgi:hypothetical protein